MPPLAGLCSRCTHASSSRTKLGRAPLFVRAYANTSTTAPPRPSSSAGRDTPAESSSAASCSSSRFNTALPPIRYHIFNEPLPYNIGLKLQNDLVQRRIERKKQGRGKTDLILFLEHIPTYTTGRRDNSPNPNTLHPEEKKVQHVGAEFHITKRGGQVTYHGPGQLVGYPLFDLNVMEMPTRCYVEYLQTLLADYVRSKGVEEVLAPHPEGHVGIFASPTEKVASIGIHLQHRITSHGFAMNITPQPLAWFDLVLACGLADVRAVSLHDLMARSALANGVLPEGTPDVRQVAEELVPRFENVFGRTLLDLQAPVGTEAVNGIQEDPQELAEVTGMIGEAEKEAKEANKEAGGWPSAPDLSRQGQNL